MLTVKEIFDLVRDDLARVEQEIASQTGATSQPVAEIARYLLDGGGKRLRPALLLLSAGYAGTPLAQRPPLLVAPVEVGKRWQFNRARYRITEVGPCSTGELSFDRCVTIEISGDDGSKNMSRYAQGVGLVEQSFAGTRMIAIAVRMPKSKSVPKNPARAR